jgi:hypothetical protein
MTAVLGFTPRLLEGSVRAPRVVFLDPQLASHRSVEECVAATLRQYGEVVFAVNRYGLYDADQRAGIRRSGLDLGGLAAPLVLHHFPRPVHAVFCRTFPPAWQTCQVRGYALSHERPTARLASMAFDWLDTLGASETNRLLWEMVS